MIKALTPKRKVHKFMTDIGGGWYTKKTAKELTPVKISKIIKNHKRSRMKLKKLYKSNKW